MSATSTTPIPAHTANFGGQLIQGQHPAAWVMDLIADYAEEISTLKDTDAEKWEIDEAKVALSGARREATRMGISKADQEAAIARGIGR